MSKKVKITGFWKRKSDNTQFVTYRVDDGEVRITNGVIDWIDSIVKCSEAYKMTYDERNFDIGKFMKYAEKSMPYADITVYLKDVLYIREQELNKEIKTESGWNRYVAGLEFQSDFNYYVKVGDKVDELLVDYFMDLLPPACMRSDCSQVGEPHSMRIDDVTGEYKNTYTTFKKISEGVWEFCGNCFRGENVERGMEIPLY